MTTVPILAATRCVGPGAENGILVTEPHCDTHMTHIGIALVDRIETDPTDPRDMDLNP